MIPGGLPLAAAPFAAWLIISPAVSPSVDPNALVEDAVCLVEIQVYQGSGASNLPPLPIAAAPIAAMPFGSSIPSGVDTLTYSDAGWIGEPTDPDKPNALYLGRAATPFQIERNSPIVPEKAQRLQVQYGQLVLLAGDGALDAAVQSYPVSGRSVKVYRGKRGYPFSTHYRDHSLVLSALATQWQQDEDRVTVDLRDTAYKLELPLQSSLYAGSGGAEGDAQFTGKPKPITLGFKRNIAPDLVDQANLIYCFHYRQANAVTAARDLGAVLPVDGGDFANYAALVAASVASGHVATCLAQGLLKLGTKPTQLTIDVRGDSVGAYTDTHAGLARKILTDLAGLTNSEFVSSSFGNWPSGAAGIYFGSDSAPTGGDAMDMVAASIAGWWGPQRDGRIIGAALFDPTSAAPDLYIRYADIRGPVTTLPLPALPRYRQRVGYQALQLVQDGANLAGSVSAADRLFYGEAYRAVTSIDASVQTRYPLAPDFPVLVTMFDGSGPAQTLADSLMGLHKKERRMFRVPLGPLGFLLDLGKVVNISYPRFGLAAGQNFVVTGTVEEAAGVDLILWG